jgi:hypothetical protein
MGGTTLFQAAGAAPIYNERMAIIFGFITLILGLSVFLSCRVCISWTNRLGIKNPTQIKGYSSFYKHHLYYWWAFGISLVAHIMVSTLHTGLPQGGDPDAGIHWVILGLGLFSGASTSSLFFSCRVLPRLLVMATPKQPFNNIFYRAFYKYHAYYWLLPALLVAAHLVAAYSHGGVWPLPEQQAIIATYNFP